MQAVASNHWDDFTEAAYGRLIEAARTGGYRFADYRERPAGRHVLWRHDVDFSMHRAVRLAEIERERDAKATYFVNPHCAFYNLLEPEITALVRRIADLGHEIGLHFDSGAYPAKSWSRESLGDLISRERNLLESFLGCQIQAFAYHNPDTSDILAIDDDEIAGLVNAYGRTLRNSYGYASDSNGYWRFRPIGEVIAAGEHERLQILTHPEWWTVEPLPPRARVARCVNGRAEKALRQYDEFLRRTGRENLAQ